MQNLPIMTASETANFFSESTLPKAKSGAVSKDFAEIFKKKLSKSEQGDIIKEPGKMDKDHKVLEKDKELKVQDVSYEENDKDQMDEEIVYPWQYTREVNPFTQWAQRRDELSNTSNKQKSSDVDSKENKEGDLSSSDDISNSQSNEEITNLWQFTRDDNPFTRWAQSNF